MVQAVCPDPEEHNALLWKDIAFMGRVGKQPATVFTGRPLTRRQMDKLRRGLRFVLKAEHDSMEHD